MTPMCLRAQHTDASTEAACPDYTAYRTALGTAPARAPNNAPERRPSPSWPQRRSARLGGRTRTAGCCPLRGLLGAARASRDLGFGSIDPVRRVIDRVHSGPATAFWNLEV